MSKPTKPELTKYRRVLKQQLATLKGDVGSMRDEALRVLRPGGVLMDGQASVRKLRPEAFDDWTHPRYDSTNNAVSRDTAVGLPRQVRWVAGPLHASGDMVSAMGRNFYGATEAKNAYNGMPLWRRGLPRYRDGR